MHTSTKWTVSIIILGNLMGGAFMAFTGPEVLPLPYLWHKALHITGMMLLNGNIMVTGFWMAMAERTGDMRIMHFGARVVDWADAWFTAPGVVLLALNGMFLSRANGGLMGTPWIVTAQILFAVSGVLWVGLVIPLQHQIIKLSKPASPEGTLRPAFFRALHRWYFWGTLATLTPLAAMVVMVLK